MNDYARATPRGRLAALVSAIAVLFLVGSAPAAQAAEKGLQVDMTWLDGIRRKTDQDMTAAAIGDLKAQWVRIDASWYQIEPSKGSYNSTWLSWTDRAIDLIHQQGGKVIMMVNETPNWASGTDDKNMPPRNPDDYANYMRFLAERWKGKVEAYEIWNEPNYQYFWSSGPDPAAYARLLRAAYPAVKSVDPSAKVLYAGLSENDYDFLEGSYAEVPDLGNYYDAMAVHPHTWPEPPEWYWYNDKGRMDKNSFPAYREVRNTMLAHGDNKPIWITEFGWATYSGSSGVSEQMQADYLTRAFKCLEQDPYVEVAAWYIYRNSYWANDADTWLDQLGLVRTDYSRKPAYDAFKSYGPGNDGCTYTLKPGAKEPATRSSETTESQPATTTPTTTAAVQPEITFNVRRASRTFRAQRRTPKAERFTLAGTVRGTSGGDVWLQLQRPRRGKWRTIKTLTQRVGSLGQFSQTRKLQAGRWRVRAIFVDRTTRAVARSAYRKFASGRSVSIKLRRAARGTRARAASMASATERFTVSGSVAHPSGGLVRLQFERARGSSWIAAGAAKRRLDATGAYRLDRQVASGRWRVRAVYVDADGDRVVSPFKTFFSGLGVLR